MNIEDISGNDETAEQAESIAPDRSLTLAQRKLAGSAHCLNCGTELRGPFCYFCGQPDRNFMRFFPALLRDVMEDVLDFDSRFMRTLKPLLFKPGRLTRDYMDGRRFRYTPPMRIYIFSSIVFFLLAAFLSSDAISTDNVQVTGDRGIIHIETTNDEEQQQVEEALEALPPGVRDQVSLNQLESETDDEADDDGFNLDDLQFNDKPWNRETNPVDIPWLPDSLNDAINDEIEQSPQKARQIEENPNLILDKIFDILPATMFILLPVVALIFKFWYLFAKRYYVEHLIFSLHNHSFIFAVLTLVLLAGVAGDLLMSYDIEGVASATEWFSIIISIWIPVYLLISLRTMYRQNWFLTISKFFVIGISYMTLLGFVTVSVVIGGFVLL